MIAALLASALLVQNVDIPPDVIGTWTCTGGVNSLTAPGDTARGSWSVVITAAPREARIILNTGISFIDSAPLRIGNLDGVGMPMGPGSFSLGDSQGMIVSISPQYGLSLMRVYGVYGRLMEWSGAACRRH